MFKEFFWAPFPNFALPVILVFVVWSLVLKGIALWKAARNNQRYWFVGLLIFNTVGILEILFLVFFQKTSLRKRSAGQENKK